MQSMGAIGHDVAFLLRELHAAFMEHLGGRPFFEWFLFFSPFFIFGEIPRYLVPAFVLLTRRILNIGRDDDEAKRRFMSTHPSVSVLLVGYNEEENIGAAIESLLEFGYPNLEIIVIDDGSLDDMYNAAKPYADEGTIKLYRNSGASGRSGRPAASNIALEVSSGDFILSVDADTSFDRDALFHMIGPFYDPMVGAVAGNLKARNSQKNYLTRLQALEYLQAITLWKTWLGLFGTNLQASGAFGAFRREAIENVAAWDSELAEDADISLKVKRSGWRIVFAQRAIAMTNVPEQLRVLMTQRYRWDRGLLRTYFRKHLSLLKFWRFHWTIGLEMAIEFLFSVMLTFFYLIWLVFMFFYFPVILLFAIVIMYFVYLGASIIMLGTAISISERTREELRLIPSIFAFPLYKSFFRWVRMYALTLEVFRVNYEQSYLPESAWRNTKRW